ncbi:FkbM family methyltransferase [Leptothoe spongobia]|uniref:FkbM family methyltransferase n=1 Tax=Leptothoe spongobia TAU-MAC 1115 TaxID=1967444 RepID=A0A947GG50_9CYAN|nr:FkbM family methyltransferase [Leptothoe spongobia]MBT9314710.1 FkbM family methyltransferase [Leptothoe spongobia TAU-MAC 1115]
MNQNFKKLLRTLQVNFHYLLETKFSLMRFYRNKLGIPFEADFKALHLFPDTDGALYLDIGANRGQSTDAILMQTKNSHIQMFEPSELLCKKLEGLYGDNKRIVINKFGLGAQAAEQDLYTPFYKKWMFDGLSSFDEAEAREWLVDGIFFFEEERLTLQKTHCQIKTLDELDLNPFFIKIDIQGYELQAIKGGREMIKTHEPILLIEQPNDDIVSYLKNLGYELYAYANGRFTSGTNGYPNTFFMTKSKAALVKEFINQ